MLTGFQHNRRPRFIRALGIIAVCLFMLSNSNPGITQSQPDPRPDTLPFFYDQSDVYDEGQTATLSRDAQLLQSTDIPVVVYVRTVSDVEARTDPAQSFADAIRRDWNVESSPGANDGLVLLYSHVSDNPQASTVVASWGATTFANNGLTPEYIGKVLDGDVRSLLDDDHPFEALVYGMREIRYAGIYFPPPPAPLEGAARVLHNAINWIGPALVLIMAGASVGISLRSGIHSIIPRRLVWKIVGATGVIAALLSTASVIVRSRIGIGSAMLIIIVLAIQVWLWTHRASQPSRKNRQRSVPPTSRLMRKRRQLRTIQTLAETPR